MRKEGYRGMFSITTECYDSVLVVYPSAGEQHCNSSCTSSRGEGRIRIICTLSVCTLTDCFAGSSSIGRTRMEDGNETLSDGRNYGADHVAVCSRLVGRVQERPGILYGNEAQRKYATRRAFMPRLFWEWCFVDRSLA